MARCRFASVPMWWDAMRSPAARWNHPKAVEKTVPWKPWKTKPRFPTAPTAPWKTRNLGEFPTFPPPCDSLFPSLKKTKGQEGSMKQADRSSVNKSGQIQKLPTVEGGRDGSTNYVIDGVYVRSLRFNNLSLQPSVDTVQEFTVLRNSFSSEYGQGQSIITAVTKSGTNALHGSAYEYLRNDQLDARN